MAKLLLEGAALEKLHVVDEEEIDGAKLLLERRGVAGLESLREAVHETLRRQVQHLCVRIARLHFPRHRMQEMRLAHADASVNIKRIVLQRLIGRAFGDLKRGGVRQPVRRADHEGLEGIARVERRALESIEARPAVASKGRNHAKGNEGGGRGWAARRGGGACHRRRLQLLDRGRCGWRTRNSSRFDARELGPATSQELVGVMGLQPVPQKLRRNRHLHHAAVIAVQFDPSKPACEDILAKFGAKTALNTPPLMFNRRCREVQSFHFNIPRRLVGHQRSIGRKVFAAAMQALRRHSEAWRLIVRIFQRCPAAPCRTGASNPAEALAFDPHRCCRRQAHGTLRVRAMAGRRWPARRRHPQDPMLSSGILSMRDTPSKGWKGAPPCNFPLALPGAGAGRAFVDLIEQNRTHMGRHRQLPRVTTRQLRHSRPAFISHSPFLLPNALRTER